MHTAVIEIEAIINSCPLTYVSSDDTEEPLTPSHLLVGHKILSLPDNLTSLRMPILKSLMCQYKEDQST